VGWVSFRAAGGSLSERPEQLGWIVLSLDPAELSLSWQNGIW